jgi:hypothetical protein
MKHLSEHVVTKRIRPDGSGYTVAAGQTDVTSDPVDTAGAEGVRFIIGFGAIVAGAACSIKARQGAAANMSDGQDLAGTAQTVGDDKDNQIFITDLFRPQERYVDLRTLRATQNVTIDFVLVELYGKGKAPVTQYATVAGLEMFSSPDEGTA